MPEIITTSGISHGIEKIISESQEFIILITPFLKIPKPLYTRLVSVNNRGIVITIVYGKTDLLKKQKDQLNELKNCRILYQENLHAKVYLNEKTAIISSMNLYDFSQINNTELGIVFTKHTDYDIFNQTYNEVDLIIDSAELKKDIHKTEDEEKDIEDLWIVGGNVVFKHFPIANIEASSEYGFITYHFINEVRDHRKLKDDYYGVLKDNLRDYRVYWSFPFTKICIYEKKNIIFDSDQDEMQYKKKAIKIANEIIKQNIS